MKLFSLNRFLAVLTKEFVQMRRNRVTFAMMIGLPIMQLLLFGFAINADPRNLPTMIDLGDNGPMTRAIVSAMQTSDYFEFIGYANGYEDGEQALRTGEVNFVVVIPPDFERDVLRGDKPEILLAADASDPSATSGAVSALSGILNIVARQNLSGPLAMVAGQPAPFTINVQRQYNPEGRTATNIVPGLLGIILSMTMVMITAVAIVKETEQGTMEMLIATPVRPLEVMLKDAGVPDISSEYLALIIILIVISLIAGKRYRQTLD